MNAIMIARYPGHQTKNVIKHFTSPEYPPRHSSVQELGSIVWSGDHGMTSVFLVSIPDAELAAAVQSITQRQNYLLSRVEGLTMEWHLGPNTQDGIQQFMSVAPK